MRNFLFLLLLSFLVFGAYASGSKATGASDFKSSTCITDFGSYPVSDASNASVIADFIQKKISTLQNKQTDIQLTFSNTSPAAYHYTFCQTYQGIPVFASEITVNVSRKNIIYSIFDDSYDMSKWKVNTTDFNWQNIPAYNTYLKKYFPKGAESSAQKMIAYDEKNGIPELCYFINLKCPNGHQRELLIARDRIVYEHDACMYRAASQDSLVTGMVFRPDPLTTAHVVYYAPYGGHDSAYQNYNDSDTYQLNIQREQKSFYAHYDSGTFSLSNQYVKLVRLGSDPIAPVTSTTPAFNYTRSQNGFLDVMVFYHLNVMRDYVHSLGFNMADTLIMPDSHASTQDNDFFAAPNNIYYGTGGVPDCQDADVIIHEYTHFLSWNANHSNGAGSSVQRSGIDEGSADYNAASYSASIDTFKWNYMFTWDGHNEYWPGRVVDDRHVYPSLPTDASLGPNYKYGVIWSSALMQIWWDIGRGPADSLFYQTLYGLGSNITLLDAAQQYIKADSLVYGGRYHCEIVRDFNQHGLAADTSCGTYPLAIQDITTASPFCKFTAYPDAFSVSALHSDAELNVDLYDMTGRRIASYANVTNMIKPSLPEGIYIVDVSSEGQHQSFRWALIR